MAIGHQPRRGRAHARHVDCVARDGRALPIGLVPGQLQGMAAAGRHGRRRRWQGDRRQRGRGRDGAPGRAALAVDGCHAVLVGRPGHQVSHLDAALGPAARRPPRCSRGTRGSGKSAMRTRGATSEAAAGAAATNSAPTVRRCLAQESRARRPGRRACRGSGSGGRRPCHQRRRWPASGCSASRRGSC